MRKGSGILIVLLLEFVRPWPDCWASPPGLVQHRSAAADLAVDSESLILASDCGQRVDDYLIFMQVDLRVVKRHAFQSSMMLNGSQDNAVNSQQQHGVLGAAGAVALGVVGAVHVGANEDSVSNGSLMKLQKDRNDTLPALPCKMAPCDAPLPLGEKVVPSAAPPPNLFKPEHAPQQGPAQASKLLPRTILIGMWKQAAMQYQATLEMVRSKAIFSSWEVMMPEGTSNLGTRMFQSAKVGIITLLPAFMVLSAAAVMMVHMV